MTDKNSFLNVQSWYQEVNQLSPVSPIILIGTKADKNPQNVTNTQALELANELLMIYDYVQLNATSTDDIQHVIELGISHLLI